MRLAQELEPIGQESTPMSSSATQAIRPPAEPSESGMILLLVGLMTLVSAQMLLALPLSLGPGLSAENAFLYVVFGALALRFGVGGNFRLELRSLHMCFVVLLVYAALSIAVAALVVQYPRYEILKAIMAFKARLADQFVFFAVFFYGVQGTRNALSVLKALLLLTTLANLGALLDAWGILDAPGLVDRADGRAQGIMGESNQSAAFIACFLPGLVAFALTSKGLARLVWLGGVTVSLTAMIISASRGGVLALLVATIWAAVYFRRYISARTVIATAGFGLLASLIVMPLIVSKYGWLLVNRFVSDTTSSDLAGASSGRIEIWTGALSVMANSPLSFITGFGWDVYNAMPFRFATHNHYVSLWFDLGLVGLIAGTALFVMAARTALKAFNHAGETERAVLGAFATGTLAIAVATFFVNLYTPWLWYWAYAGLVMRIAVNHQIEERREAAEESSARAVAPVQDAYGWVGTMHR
jgi:O-antigen ligase